MNEQLNCILLGNTSKYIQTFIYGIACNRDEFKDCANKAFIYKFYEKYGCDSIDLDNNVKKFVAMFNNKYNCVDETCTNLKLIDCNNLVLENDENNPCELEVL